MNFNRPLLIVVSAPSGAGKSTLCNKLLAESKSLVYSISCTTRKPRGQEKDGVAYYFLSEEEFVARIENGDFLENAIVHGNRYGTLRSTVEQALTQGKSIIMDIDVAGAAQVRDIIKALPEDNVIRNAFIDIFITVPSIEELEARLNKRGEDAPDVIQKRVANAKGEIARANEYQHIVVNDDLECAYMQLCVILTEASK
jgi:guanylate kinase